VFLSMIGWERDAQTGEYSFDKESRWVQLLGKEGLAELRKNVLVAPDIYGAHSVVRGGETHEATSKIHHKILVSGPAAIAGTSFNFSAAADKQSEQLVVFLDPKVVEFVRSLHDGLKEAGAKTLQWAVSRRSQRQNEPEAAEHYAKTGGNNREAEQIIVMARAAFRKRDNCDDMAKLAPRRFRAAGAQASKAPPPPPALFVRPKPRTN
jgi:hypothetical protein